MGTPGQVIFAPDPQLPHQLLCPAPKPSLPLPSGRRGRGCRGGRKRGDSPGVPRRLWSGPPGAKGEKVSVGRLWGGGQG